jgi:hypothetical protein
MSEVTVTKGIETESSSMDEMSLRFTPEDEVVIRLTNRNSTANEHRGDGRPEREARAAFRAAVIGGIAGVTLAAFVTRRRLTAYVLEPRQRVSPKDRRRYARRSGRRR